MKTLSTLALAGALALATTAVFAQAPGSSSTTEPRAADTSKAGPTPAQVDTKSKMSPGSESKASGNSSMTAPSTPSTGKVDARGDQTPASAQAPNKMSDGKTKTDSTVGAGSTDPITRGKDNDKQNKAQ